MAQENEPMKSSAQLDLARLALEQRAAQNEATRIYLERWRVDLEPLHEHRLMSRRQANDYAKAAGQMLFLLNGGALLAFPAIAELLGTGFRGHISLVISGMGAFFAGLVTVGIATLLAFLANVSDAGAVQHREEFIKLGLNKSNAPAEQQATFDERRDQEENERKDKIRLANLLALWGFFLYAASLIAFVVGTVCLARLIWLGP